MRQAICLVPHLTYPLFPIIIFMTDLGQWIYRYINCSVFPLMIQSRRIINDRADHMRQKCHIQFNFNKVAALLLPLPPSSHYTLTLTPPFHHLISSHPPNILHYFVPAYRLRLLICFPYLKNTYGNGAITNVNIANKNVAHWYPKRLYIAFPNSGKPAANMLLLNEFAASALAA